MERIISLTDREAALAARGELRAIVRKIKLPPDNWWGCDPETVKLGEIYIPQVVKCPFGAPGDTLACKESYAYVHPLQISEGRFSMESTAGIPGPPNIPYRTVYKADGSLPPIWHTLKYPYRTLDASLSECFPEHFPQGVEKTFWYSPVLMPREYIRLRFMVKSVRAFQPVGMRNLLMEIYGKSFKLDDWLWYGGIEPLETGGNE